jgi:hypothetical protein
MFLDCSYRLTLLTFCCSCSFQLQTYTPDFLLFMQFPRAASFLSMDFGSLLGPFFFTLAFNLVFPTIVVSLVYEKEVVCRSSFKPFHLSIMICMVFMK